MPRTEIRRHLEEHRGPHEMSQEMDTTFLPAYPYMIYREYFRRLIASSCNGVYGVCADARRFEFAGPLRLGRKISLQPIWDYPECDFHTILCSLSYGIVERNTPLYFRTALYFGEKTYWASF